MTNAHSLSLQPNRALTVKAAQLRVESGIVWLTQDGQSADVLLYAGQSFKAHRRGRIVIESLAAETRVSLQPRPVFSGFGQRLAALLDRGMASLRPALGACDNRLGGTRL